jgi:hypothetical protein
MSPIVWDPPESAPPRPAPVERPSMAKEVGQSFYLMGLVALTLTFYLGVGLLAIRLFG